MTIARPLKLALLFLTLWSPLYIVAFMVMMFSAPRTLPFERLMVVHVATMALNALLMIFYVVHLFRSQRIASERRVMWLILLFMGAPIAMSAYWYAYVRPDE